MRDLNPGDSHDVPPIIASIEQGCGCDISPDSKELAFTENLDPVPADLDACATSLRLT